MPSTTVPGFRYADAVAAIDFLCKAFGFERHAVYADDANPRLIHHAQLTLGDGMIMLGSARSDETQRLHGWKTPMQAGGNTVSLHVTVADPDAHCARARDAGAEIVTEPSDNDGYPGRGYVARDPEGHVWSFGSYNPRNDGRQNRARPGAGFGIARSHRSAPFPPARLPHAAQDFRHPRCGRPRPQFDVQRRSSRLLLRAGTACLCLRRRRRMGATRCDLQAVDEATLASALGAAHALARPKARRRQPAAAQENAPPG